MAAPVPLQGSGQHDENDERPEVRACRMSNSTTLDLSHHKLKDLPDGVFRLQHVKSLYLEGNLLSEIPLQLFDNLKQLTWLDLRNNIVQELPPQICYLKCLNNLLLEGNQITKLPVELCFLTRLTGLNLKGNPLEFPPKNIIDQGLKTILKYLREHHDAHNNNNNNNNNNTIDQGLILPDEVSEEKSPHRHMFEILDDDSTDEDIAGHRAVDSRLRQMHLHSAPVSRAPRGEKRTMKKGKKKKVVEERDSGYMRREPIHSTYIRHVKDAQRRTQNEQVDAVIQKRRSKVVLDEWRKETAALQRTKRRSKSVPKHEIDIPYGNDISPPVPTELEADEDVELHAQLDERIQEHVRNIKEWRLKTKTPLTLEDELQETKKNLEKAQKLQRVLEKKKVLEIRSNTFDYNDLSDAVNKAAGARKPQKR